MINDCRKVTALLLFVRSSKIGVVRRLAHYLKGNFHKTFYLTINDCLNK